MGVFKSVLKPIRRVIKSNPITSGIFQATGLESISNQIIGPEGGGDAAAPAETPAEELATTETEDLERRRRAIASLTQTSSLGAGTPTTTRRSVLGV